MEVEKLYSRLEQQSSLICMLKQRNDTTLRELSEVTNRCEVTCKELEELQVSLAEEIGQKRKLEYRFQVLASNHEEMIKIKDQYKAEVQQYKAEVQQYKAEVQQYKAEVQQLKAEKKSMEEEEEERDWKGKLRSLEEETEKNERQWKDKVKLLGVEKEEASRRVDEMKKSLVTATREHNSTVKDLQTQLCGLRTASEQACNLKEREVTSLQDKLFQVKEELQLSSTNLQLASKKVMSLEKELASAKEREVKREEDADISSLKRELVHCQQQLLTVEEEYAAYKAHSSEQLAYEKKLNKQLRHLLG